MPKSLPLPDAERLSSLLDYDPETGELRWKKTGRVIAAKSKTGHIQVGFEGRVLYAHRVIWKLVSGADPSDEIDHANCDPSDNRWVNLRQADRVTNNANRRTNKNNTSGFKGVRMHKCGKWVSRITVCREEIHLGLFDTPQQAYAAYCDAANKYFGEFARVA